MLGMAVRGGGTAVEVVPAPEAASDGGAAAVVGGPTEGAVGGFAGDATVVGVRATVVAGAVEVELSSRDSRTTAVATPPARRRTIATTKAVGVLRLTLFSPLGVRPWNWEAAGPGRRPPA